MLSLCSILFDVPGFYCYCCTCLMFLCIMLFLMLYAVVVVVYRLLTICMHIRYVTVQHLLCSERWWKWRKVLKTVLLLCLEFIIDFYWLLLVIVLVFDFTFDLGRVYRKNYTYTHKHVNKMENLSFYFKQLNLIQKPKIYSIFRFLFSFVI